MSTYTPAPYRFGFSDPEGHIATTSRGLNEATVREISALKNEPEWMLQKRLAALRVFQSKPLPTWGPDLNAIDFNNLTYFHRVAEKPERTWDDVPSTIKQTFERIGVPEAERAYLAGVGAQYDSEAVYHNLREEWEKQGIVFLDTDTALKKYPEVIKKYFGTVIPPQDNMFAALNTALWSGGSFVFIPAGVHLDTPLQAYFRINARSSGQFERTMILVEPGAYVHYVEGCSAPVYSADSLHAAVVEIVAMEGARVRYTTVQNWSSNVYNLVTKRAQAKRDAIVEWVDCNIGAKVTMKYPSVYLMGERARAEILSLTVAGPGQHQDAGAKALHLAPHTSSVITAKSISYGGGRSSYRGMVLSNTNATDIKSRTVCDALLLDSISESDTYPTIDIAHPECKIEHEASVSQVSEEQLHYLQSRGLTTNEAASLIVNGFIEPIVKELPMEYAVEMNRLIAMQMEGSVG